MKTATLNKVTILAARAKADKEVNLDAAATRKTRDSKAVQAGADNKVSKVHLIAAVSKVRDNKVRGNKVSKVKKANREKKVREKKVRKVEFLQAGVVHR
jgi:hypothetical protein